MHAAFDPSLLAFKPAVPAPSNAPINWRKMNPEEFHDPEFETQMNEVLDKDYIKFWNAVTQ